MEQKLAEFRARRKVNMASMCESKREQSESQQANTFIYQTLSCNPSVGVTDELGSGDSKIRVSGSSQSGLDWWLMDSALGRWLGLKRLAFTNLTLLKVLLWLVLLGLFSELEFGFPFFLISLFYWLYEGLRSPAERQPGELSAYSVFNPDCQPILGTLTAEQLEGEMGYGALPNR